MRKLSDLVESGEITQAEADERLEEILRQRDAAVHEPSSAIRVADAGMTQPERQSRPE